MRVRSSLVGSGLLSILLVLACDSANPVAPKGTVLTVTAVPSQIAIGGVATISVTGFKPDGNPLNPGTQILLSQSGVSSPPPPPPPPPPPSSAPGGQAVDGSAVLEATVIEIGADGRAATRLLGGDRPESVTITAATVTGDARATVDVRVGQSDDTKPVLTLTASPGTVGFGETSQISILARRADGSNVGAGLRIRLRTTLGQIASEVSTDADGEAEATLTAGSVPGDAVVTAVPDNGDEAMVTVTIENRKPRLLISANPSSIAVLGTSEITVIARDSFDNPLGSGNRITLTADLGTVPTSVTTDANGEARTTFTAGNEAGDGEVTAILGSSDPASVSIRIRDAAASISLTPNPSSIARGDATIDLTAIVRNSQGQPVSSILVTFRSEIGTLASGGRGVNTNTQGEATDTLTVKQAEIGNRTSFQIEASVVSEGRTLVDVRTINIQ